jgi:hypothetical protein
MTGDTRKSDGHLSSFHVELLRAGVASADERAWMEAHLRACGRCSEMAASFEAHRREFANSHPRPASTPPPTADLTARRRALKRIGFAVALPAAAAFALFVSLRRPAPEAQPGSDVSAKGGAGLTLVARRAGRVFPVDSGVALKAGDQVRFVIDHVRHRYVIVGSIDGSGHTSIYFPYEGIESVPIANGARVEVPGGIVIDASPGPERFFALFSDHPLQTFSIRRALDAVGKRGAGGIRNASRLDVGADEEASVLVEKTTQ